jgi:hypothetical protein
MAYASESLNGATSALVPGNETTMAMGDADCYRTADYLLQYASSVRRAICPPASFWDSCTRYLTTSADLTRLADSAQQRLRYCYVIPLLRSATRPGIGEQVPVDLLVRQGREEEAIGIARTKADNGDQDAVDYLVDLMRRLDRLDEATEFLRSRSSAEDLKATWRLADLLARKDRFGDAIRLLHAWGASTGQDTSHQIADHFVGVAARLAELMRQCQSGDQSACQRGFNLQKSFIDQLSEIEEVFQLINERIDAGDLYVSDQLILFSANMMIPGDNPDEAIEYLRSKIDEAIAFIPPKRDDAIEYLRSKEGAGLPSASGRLVDLLAERGRVEEAIGILRAQLDRGDERAQDRLTDLLAKQGDADGLRTLADAGSYPAIYRLVDLLVRQGQAEEAIGILQPLAYGGNDYAAGKLAKLLIERGDISELRALADAGIQAASHELADWLAGQGKFDDAIKILMTQISYGHYTTSVIITGMLRQNGRREEAGRLLHFGLTADGEIASAPDGVDPATYTLPEGPGVSVQEVQHMVKTFLPEWELKIN